MKNTLPLMITFLFVCTTYSCKDSKTPILVNSPKTEVAAQKVDNRSSIKASGIEPGWNITMDPAKGELYSFTFSSARFESPVAGSLKLVTPSKGKNQPRATYQGKIDDGKSITVLVDDIDCFDMAGNSHPGEMRITFEDYDFVGCVKQN